MTILLLIRFNICWLVFYLQNYSKKFTEIKLLQRPVCSREHCLCFDSIFTPAVMSKPYPIWSPIQTLHCGLIFSHKIWQIIENIKTHDKYTFILWTIVLSRQTRWRMYYWHSCKPRLKKILLPTKLLCWTFCIGPRKTVYW